MSVSDITVSGLTTTGDVKGVKLKWAYSDPRSGALQNIALDAVEVWGGAVNDRADGGFAKFGEGQTDFLHAGLGRGDARYYWIKARDKIGGLGAWYPSGATSGVLGTEASGNVSLVQVNGYVVHPSGIIDQWGTAITDVTGVVVVDLPMNFPNDFMSVIATPSAGGFLNPAFCMIYPTALTPTSQLTIRAWKVTPGSPANAVAGAVSVWWRALGY